MNTKNKGAVKAGDGTYIFALPEMAGMAAGIGYSTAFGPVVEGERMQVGLINKRRGTGAKPHTHPNEQWNYIVQGTLRVSIGDQPEQLCGPGTLLYSRPTSCTRQSRHPMKTSSSSPSRTFHMAYMARRSTVLLTVVTLSLVSRTSNSHRPVMQ